MKDDGEPQHFTDRVLLQSESDGRFGQISCRTPVSWKRQYRKLRLKRLQPAEKVVVASPLP
jgi:hypothetical protein